LPLEWDARAAREGRRYRVSCAPSPIDIFDTAVPLAWRVELFNLIGKTTNIDWLIVTSQVGNASDMLNEVVEHLSHGLNTWDELPWPHVWLGAPVVTQRDVDRDVTRLLAVSARLRFLLADPMQGAIRIPWDWLHGGNGHEGIDWVVCGGGASPLHPDWVMSLRDQCKAAGVPFYFRNWGDWVPMMGHADGVPVHSPKYSHSDGTIMGRTVARVGALAGCTHRATPCEAA
jgi:protein gp37